MKNLLEQLQQLAPLAAQATAGPWHIGRWRQGNEPWAPTLTPEMGAPICRMDRHGTPLKDAADAAFIAAARNLLTPENLTLFIALLGNMESVMETNRVLAKRQVEIQGILDAALQDDTMLFLISATLNPSK